MSSPAYIDVAGDGAGTTPATNPVFLGAINVLWFMTVGWFLWSKDY